MLLMAEEDASMVNSEKIPPMIEDLRNHTPEQLTELRLLVNAGFTGRPDVRRPGFYELDGVTHVYYVFRYPSGHKVLLLAVWRRESDPASELAAYSCPAA